MKHLMTITAIAIAMLFAPIAAQTAKAVDAHHPGQTAKTKKATKTPAIKPQKTKKTTPGTSELRRGEASPRGEVSWEISSQARKKARMMNCPMMPGGQMGKGGMMNCPMMSSGSGGMMQSGQNMGGAMMMQGWNAMMWPWRVAFNNWNAMMRGEGMMHSGAGMGGQAR